MSYIDTFDHEYCGHLGYLPIYHPLETVQNGDEFDCDPSCLVLGGGSGEHSALIVEKLEFVVASFLLDIVEQQTEIDISPNTVEKLQDIYCDTRDSAFLFNKWSIREYAAIQEMAKSKVNFTPLKEDQSVEDWIFSSLGEFVYFSLPELVALPEKVLIEFRKADLGARLCNVRCLPFGYPKLYGRLVIDGELKWGKHRF